MANTQDEKAKYKFKMKLEVRWSDMDQMGHVNNALYLTYFEQARIEYLQEVCQWNWTETGAILANAYVDYRLPIVYPAPTHVYVRVSKMGNKSFEISYMIVAQIAGKEEITTTGYTTLVVFDYDKKHSVFIPETIRQQIETYENHTFELKS
ncbi:thioesterase family protein [Dyadobacter sp. CY312]|uniref:acyl-CoA thioesterase n=1 Tax=Dyadobacter sp. CY312 TaxID=2907303 RepID=UPI001F35ABE9|nr:thioesterase family protein [Dyadobacter sp. CY312]MCE7041505.1 acyl-CoA thioesterase [Dyadobacter sp. CY312]